MTIDLPGSDEPCVSVIIPCSVRSDLLRGCLQSVARFAPAHIPFQTIVVLNGTDAGTEAELRALAPGVDVVRSSVNLGVAGAGNLARSRARGSYLILLHDDAEILPGWMEALVETADARPDAGAVGSKVLFPDGTLQSAGMILWREAVTSPRWAGDPPAAATFDTMEPVDYCATSSLLVRASAWDEIGGPDEELYPAYFVDVDLCLALRQCGHVILFEPRSQIHHHRAGSTHPRFRHFVANRNREYFMVKWAAALGQQEPFERDSPAAIARALARVQSSGARRPSEAVSPRRTPRAFDATRCQDEHRARADALRAAYLVHLEKIADEADTDRARLRTEVENLSKEKQEVYTKLWHEKEEAVQAYGKVWHEKEEVAQARDKLWQEKEELVQAYGNLWHEREKLAQERSKLEAMLAESVRRRGESDRALDALLRSRAWRMTAPLRAIADFLRKLLPKDRAPQ